MMCSAATAQPVEHAENPEWWPDPLAVFRLRCWARASLWANCMLDLHEAVDVLEAMAERDGLTQQIGQDRIQEIIATEFGIAHA